jgi:hypothetical protein
MVNRLDDLEFDGLLPTTWREASEMNYTPVDVARRAADLLVDAPGRWILDVGAGVGKFCLVAAARARGAMFVGIESRRYLVRVANSLARRLDLMNVAFLHGDAAGADWAAFDGFYLFNPFVDLGFAGFRACVRLVRERLATARLGTRVVTYHGFGAPPPAGYALFHQELIGTGPLELWVKTGASDGARS